jgi:opacity protein-like surface antigen
LLAAPEASAGGYKPYVSVFGGASVLTQNPHGKYSNSYSIPFEIMMNNPGYIIGGAVGVDWGNNIRTELELSHARWSSDKSHYTRDGFPGTSFASSNVSATYLLGNVWFDFNQGSRITPYVGGGLGVGWANVNLATDTSYATNFGSSGLAFQIGAGFRFDVSENVMIDAGYRFKDIVGLNYGTINYNTIADTSLASHNFQVGLTLKF